MAAAGAGANVEDVDDANLRAHAEDMQRELRNLQRQLQQQRSYLLSRGFDVTVVGLANSQRFVASPNGIDLKTWKDQLHGASSRMDGRLFARRVLPPAA